MKVQSFDNIEDLFATIEAERVQADLRCEPWQNDIAPGTYALRFAPEDRLFIWIEVLDVIEEERKAGGGEEELARLREQYTTTLKHYRFSRCFTPICPDGELGDFHVSTAMCRITKEQFEKARTLGWPTSASGVIEVLQVAETIPARHELFPDFFS